MKIVELLKSAPGFRRLWLGNLISSCGDWIGWVAVSILAMQSESGPLQLAGVFVAHYLPSALLAPLGGYFADRWDRKKILVYVAAGQMLLTVAMAIAAIQGEVLGVQLLLAVRSTAVAFIAPAERGAVPRLVAPSQVVLANAVDSATWSVMFTVGTALGGLISALGPSTALSIDAGTFVLAILFYLRLPNIVPKDQPNASSSENQDTPQVPKMREVLAWLWSEPKILGATFAKGPLSLASGAAWLALNLTASQKSTGVDASIALGAFYALRGIGTAAGPFMAQAVQQRGFSERTVWSACYGAGVLAMWGFWASFEWWAWGLCAFVWGVSGGVNWVISTAITQRDVPDRYRGRIGALDTLTWMGAQCLAVGWCAWQVHHNHPLDPSLLTMCVAAVVGMTILQVNAMRATNTPA